MSFKRVNCNDRNEVERTSRASRLMGVEYRFLSTRDSERPSTGLMTDLVPSSPLPWTRAGTSRHRTPSNAAVSKPHGMWGSIT